MIYTKMLGGLGNNIWQATTAQVMAWKNNDEVSLVIDRIIETDPGIPSSGNHPGTHRVYLNSILSKFKTVQANMIRNRLINCDNAFDCASVFKYSPNAYFKGYWQMPEFLDGYEKEVKELIVVADENTIAAQLFLDNNNLSIDNTVIVHIRRGDYLKLKWELSVDYYNEAMKHFPGLNFVFVGNDIAWARDNFPGHIYNNLDTCLDDFALLKLCNKRIISNSTFAWWPAYLGDDEKTITPANWIPRSNSTIVNLDKWVKI